ncbi:MAG: hypothetical protein KKC79_19925 [Gammaproteobacteria bacterium]|nr:hypothetical protein [Gammaproteobacteria bacterium]MBU1442395.1 hypothetical protein [Gammaproteobacteria bacterium]MBU2284826.1 hypothetical protein [Gammaproteobacteria bacterium]MBU2410905.1 hypothetical protein [Gammaproteobacteria bacterium]
MDSVGADETLYIGLTELELGDRQFDLGEGIMLRGSAATFMYPFTLVNTDKESMRVSQGQLGADGYPPLPQPAFWHLGGRQTVVSAEIQVPAEAARSHAERFAIARTLVFVLRLWSNPAICMHAMSSGAFSSAQALSAARVVPLETWPRHVALGLIDGSKVLESISWVGDNWREAHWLYASSAEFRLAADALDSGQFIQNDALVLVSLWGALESIFSPSTSELKFRVSALVASYLEPLGPARAALQKEVARLYDKRSAAAHGKPRHEKADVLASFELLRKVLIKMIREKAVPTKEALELRLFGAA